MSVDAEKILAVRTGKTIYKDNGTVLKVFSEDYSKADILNEALNHARIEETGLRVPKLLEVTTFGRKWAIRIEFVEGKTIRRLMDESPEKRGELLELFVNTQVDIFSRKAPSLNKLKDKMGRKITKSGLDATVRYDLHTRLDTLPSGVEICHGDFNPSNIIISPDGVPYIIDWSHATQGDSAADAAHSFLLFWMDGEIDLAERYLSLFCEKRGMDRRNALRWMPVVAASRLSKGKPQEREFLLRWTDVIDFE